MRDQPSRPAVRRPRRLGVGVFAALVALGLAPGDAMGQGPTAAPRRADSGDGMIEALSRRGDLTLRDATLESALFTISELWGVNIVAGQVDGAVNGVFKDAPLKDILDSILQSNGYAYRLVGQSLIVSRAADLGAVNPFFATQTISVGAAEVGEVVEAARLLSTPQGQVRALPSAGAVLVVDFPERVQKISDLIRQLDAATRVAAGPAAAVRGPRQLEVAYFRMHYVPALQAATALEVVLSDQGRVSSVEAEDRLLVVDYPENVRMVEAVLARIDRPRPQVNIKSLIYDISLSDLEQIGVNWDGLTSGTATDGTPDSGNGALFTTVTQTPFGATDTGSSFTFFSMSNDFNLQAVVLALQQAEDSRLLADPNVTVMDNESAQIESIQEVPFQQLTQTTGGGNIGTTAFKEIGIKLDVTPKISNEGTIDLTVMPEFSRLSGFTPGDNQPIVETRRATTRVRVVNGQTLMIAGLRQRADVGDFDGVPLLKDIRFVGHLFRSRNTTITESELVVFVTPEIVGYSDPLGRRDQLSADTVNCRLDLIPAAEGCPVCGVEGPCGCQPQDGAPITETVIAPAVGPTPAMVETVSGPSLQEAEATDQTTPTLPELVPNEPAPTTVEEIGRPSVSRAPEAAWPRQPSLAAGRVRRLPSVSGEPLPTYEALLTTTPSASQAVAPERPMRVAYDSRFRAPGGLKAEPTRPASDAQDDRAEKRRRSFLDQIFRR